MLLVLVVAMEAVAVAVMGVWGRRRRGWWLARRRPSGLKRPSPAAASRCSFMMRLYVSCTSSGTRIMRFRFSELRAVARIQMVA